MKVTWRKLLPKKLNYIDLCAYFICAIFIVAGILISINRFWQYEAYYIDFGIFDQAIWKVSRFQPPIIEHFIIGGKWIFADHFNPSIFILSPLYWLTQRAEMLFVVQAIAVGISGYILYMIGKSVLKNNFLSLCILICYFLFVGLQNAVITEFHELTVATLFMMLTFWAIIKKQVKLFFLFFIITLGFKESLFATGIGIGLSIFFIQKSWFKIALLSIFISIVWGLVSIEFIIPAFSDGIYIYSPILPNNIFEAISAMVNHPDKIKTLFYSFLSFGFLPFFSPAFWPIILQDYALRFIPDGFGTRMGMGLHYNAQGAVTLSIASIFALKNFMKIKKIQKLIYLFGIILVFNSFFLYRFILNGPFGLFYNQDFYKHTKELHFLDELVGKIPSSASVMTHNNLASRFTHQEVWLLRENYYTYKPEYILIDNRKGQNPNDFFASPKNIFDIIEAIKLDPKYSLIYHTEEQFIFKRGININ